MESGHVPRRLDKFECTGPRCPDKAKMSGHDEVSRCRGVEVLFFPIHQRFTAAAAGSEVGAAAGEIHAKTDLRMRQVCLPALLEVPNPGEWMNRNTACSVAAACILGVALGDPSRPRLENQPLEFSMLFKDHGQRGSAFFW